MKAGDKAKKIVLAYVPVLHEGYRRFFDKHSGAAEHSNAWKLILIGPEIIKEFKPLAKDLRALPPELMKKAVDSLKYFEEIEVADFAMLDSLNDSSISIVMPDEDVMHELHDRHFPNVKAEYDNIFLRWDKHKSFEGQQVEADQTISIEDFDKKVIKELKKEAGKSADFWRHIGAAVVKNGKIILMAHNKAVPDEQMNYVEGDPRSDFHKGVNVELSLFFHSEAQLIAEAARKGISLEGASMYATTFPCPPCAKLIAYSGIKKLYYADGYGMLDGERVLKSQGVEIIFVKMG
jgi:dCMP deaminase